MALQMCLKYLMFALNIILFIGGIAIVAAASWAVVNTDSFMDLIEDEATLMNAIYVILAAGVILLFIGFFGCLGAIKENKCLLGTYFVIIFLVFLLEIVGGILAFVKFAALEEYVIDTMQDYDLVNSTKVSWDLVQTQFECCGYEGPSDWDFRPSVPDSCPNRLLGFLAETRGCKEAFKQYFNVAGGIALAVLFVEILALGMSAYLFSQVDQEEYYY